MVPGIEQAVPGLVTLMARVRLFEKGEERHRI
jgi:hypothetical protein